MRFDTLRGYYHNLACRPVGVGLCCRAVSFLPSGQATQSQPPLRASRRDSLSVYSQQYFATNNKETFVVNTLCGAVGGLFSIFDLFFILYTNLYDGNSHCDNVPFNGLWITVLKF